MGHRGVCEAIAAGFVAAAWRDEGLAEPGDEAALDGAAIVAALSRAAAAAAPPPDAGRRAGGRRPR